MQVKSSYTAAAPGTSNSRRSWRIWSRRNVRFAHVSLARSSAGTSNSRRAADDLGELLRDCRLAGFVVDELQLVDDRPGVVGRRLHRHHPRALLRGHVLVDRLIDDRFHVAAQKL